ncbi:hypothetical protein MFM001_23210 [Mycobacterium sp. MFM001]|uniref:phage major capsid protein n=1 Tax=Mycobacterium sp. MFM001 TaxID=2049453 RepID=UPI000DA4489B|nr:phage major capsid protein [Mycobacterium sp. MFM001]GBE65859.1 hypothetical protein MFM001_23210 [Mycobacterium sp. MFM001]
MNDAMLRHRAQELKDEIALKTADLEGGRITAAQYKSFVDRAVEESGEIETHLKALATGGRFMASQDAALESLATQDWSNGAPSMKAFGVGSTVPGYLDAGQANELRVALETKRPCTLEVDVRKAFASGIHFKTATAESALINGPLPGIMQPNRFISLPYEPTRIASYLPAAAMDGPSSYWLQHTSNAAEANGVAELGSKPDLGMTFTENKVLPQKLAGQASVSMEFNMDYPELGGWMQAELQRSLINQENNYILNAGAAGGPTGAAFTGLLGVSGTLTQDATGTNGLDAIAYAAQALRSSTAAYSPPDLLILSPATVTALLTTKDDTGRYVLDMLQGPAGNLTWNGDAAAHATTNPSLGGIWPQGNEGGNLSLFGVPVVQSTQIANGVGVMLSIRGGAAVYWTRLNMLIIFDPYTGLTNNTWRWVIESRISLSTPRPGAINIIENLPFV